MTQVLDKPIIKSYAIPGVKLNANHFHLLSSEIVQKPLCWGLPLTLNTSVRCRQTYNSILMHTVCQIMSNVVKNISDKIELWQQSKKKNSIQFKRNFGGIKYVTISLYHIPALSNDCAVNRWGEVEFVFFVFFYFLKKKKKPSDILTASERILALVVFRPFIYCPQHSFSCTVPASALLWMFEIPSVLYHLSCWQKRGQFFLVLHLQFLSPSAPAETEWTQHF